VRSSLYGDILARLTLPIATRTNGTVNGTTVDKSDPTGGVDGFTSALLVVLAGTLTDGTQTVTLQDSDDGSSWAAAANDTIVGQATSSVAIAATADDTIVEMGYTGPKRYLRASVVTSGATSGGTLGAVIVLGGETSTPVKR
jgi:hypothetical protein